MERRPLDVLKDWLRNTLILGALTVWTSGVWLTATGHSLTQQFGWLQGLTVSGWWMLPALPFWGFILIPFLPSPARWQHGYTPRERTQQLWRWAGSIIAGLICSFVLTRADPMTALGIFGCLAGSGLFFGMMGGLVALDKPGSVWDLLELGSVVSAIVAIVAGPIAGLAILVAYCIPWGVSFSVVFLIAHACRWLRDLTRIGRTVA